MQLDNRARNVIIGTGGFFAGLTAAQVVDWATVPKALLAAGVAVAVSLVLWSCLH